MFERISFDPKVMGGRACVKGTRILVATIVSQLAHRVTVEEILGDYPREVVLKIMSTTILWTLPVAPTSLTAEPVLTLLPRRTYQLRLEWGSAQDPVTCALEFRGVISQCTTFLFGLSEGMLDSDYGRLVDMGSSDWLAKATATPRRELQGKSIRHLRISFDDGPCYEFLCESHSIGFEGQAEAQD
jgi:uncharacterized protein (DUF433 family)